MTTSDISEQKKDLREALKQKLKSLPQAERDLRSVSIRRSILKSPFWEKARTLLIYAALPAEVETRELMREILRTGRKLFLPRIDERTREILAVEVSAVEELVKGPFGIEEPSSGKVPLTDLSILDAVFVPGIAFDRRGNRLGRGLGYYDRFLAKLGPGTLKIGLAFDFQIVETVPCEAHDIRLDMLILDEKESLS